MSKMLLIARLEESIFVHLFPNMFPLSNSISEVRRLVFDILACEG